MATDARRVMFIATITLAGVVAAACGSAGPPSQAAPSLAATPAPTRTPAPTPTRAPTPTPTATPAPTDSPRVDPTVDLEIAKPYTLAGLDSVTAAMLEAGMKEGLGTMADVLEIGARQVSKDGTPVAIVLGMRFPGVPMGDGSSFLDATVGGAAATTGTEVTRAKVDGRQVRIGESPASAFAAYQQDDMIVFAIGASAKEMKAVVAALIGANP